jgi:hypothetical protein
VVTFIDHFLTRRSATQSGDSSVLMCTQISSAHTIWPEAAWGGKTRSSDLNLQLRRSE